MTFRIVIPARYGSTRLPAKVLRLLAGKPMIEHVCLQALQAGAAEVVVATDDQRIVDAVAHLDVRAVMTSDSHRSGTERLVETARLCGWGDSELVVNVQGDEPLMEPALITKLARALDSHPEDSVATLAAPIQHQETLFNPNVVKVVCDYRWRALYFSRAPIPWRRNEFSYDPAKPVSPLLNEYWRHIGIYAYSVAFLRRYANWTVSPIETSESLEQLRILWHGERMLVVPLEQEPHGGVDTLEDLERVEGILKARNPE